MSLKAGQLAADSEFFNTKYTDVFTNASLGWPAITSVNLPSGGPSPPLAALGARLRVNVNDNVTLLGAVFDGNSAGPGTTIRNCAIAMAPISGSTILRYCSAKFSTPGTARRTTPILPAH